MIKRIFTMILVFILAFSLTAPSFAIGFSSDGSSGGIQIEIGGHAIDSNISDTMEQVTTKYRGLVQGISGICIMTAVLCLLIQISKLGASGDNEQGRKKAIMGILFAGAAIALFGGIELVVTFFWRALIN